MKEMLYLIQIIVKTVLLLFLQIIFIFALTYCFSFILGFKMGFEFIMAFIATYMIILYKWAKNLKSG